MKLEPEDIERLREYVIRKGFKYEGTWYFRATWMDRKLFRKLEEKGLIKKAGILYELKSKGVRFPNKGGYYGRGVFASLIWQVEDSKINQKNL